MAISKVKQTEKYTYRDYLRLPMDERWELIDGVAYNMSPAPSRVHQQISHELSRQIGNYLVGKNCKVYSAPFDVRLPRKNERDDDATTVIQPDIVVVCDREKLDERGCKGSPNLVVEILSPETARKDLKEKFALYERSGVQEYWIVQPADKTVMVFRLGADGNYGRPDVYSEEDSAPVGILAGLAIDLKLVFQQ